MKGRDPLWQTAWFFILPVKKYNLVSDESADYMNEVAELARQTVAHARRLAVVRIHTRAGTGNGHTGG